MILVDSSAWIPYYRSSDSKNLQEALQRLIADDVIAVNGIIMVEILGGISQEDDFKKVESDFLGFHILDLNEETFSKASSLGSSLRRKGVIIPATDLIVAASAIQNDCPLYHIDKHFDILSKHTNLKAHNLGK